MDANEAMFTADEVRKMIKTASIWSYDRGTWYATRLTLGENPEQDVGYHKLCEDMVAQTLGPALHRKGSK